MGEGEAERKRGETPVPDRELLIPDQRLQNQNPASGSHGVPDFLQNPYDIGFTEAVEKLAHPPDVGLTRQGCWAKHIDSMESNTMRKTCFCDVFLRQRYLLRQVKDRYGNFVVITAAA